MLNKLYYIPNIQYLSYGTNDAGVENNPMNSFNTLIYKGSANTIDFVIRDKDRKPISLLDKTLTVYISDSQNEQLYLTRTLTKINETKGFVRLTLDENDLAELPVTFYKYTVVIDEDNGRQGFAFIDQVYRVTGFFELRDDALPNPSDVNIINTFIDESFFFDDDTYVSSVVESNGTNLHTFVWYLDDLDATIKIQGTLNNLPPADDNTAWADLWTTSYTAASTGDGLVYANIEGLYTYFRFIYEPNSTNTGSVTQILYR